MTKRDVPNFFEQVYFVTKQIPRGCVTTYGTIARLLTGRTSAARTVGWALHGLPEGLVDEVPWWRVINAQGRITNSGSPQAAAEQRARLEEDGVVVGVDGRVDLGRFGWFGDGGEASDQKPG